MLEEERRRRSTAFHVRAMMGGGEVGMICDRSEPVLLVVAEVYPSRELETTK